MDEEAAAAEKRDLNRLKAKARIQEQERSREPSSSTNENHKRPLEVTPFDSTSPTQPDRRHVPRDSLNTTKAASALQSALRESTPATAASGSSTSKVVSGVTGRSAKAQSQASEVSPAKDSQGRLVRTSEFVEYDLSTLKNSKGGFLLIEEEDDPRIARQRRLEEERKQQRQKEAARLNEEPALWNAKEGAAKCQICNTVELDFQIWRIFGVPVCPKCKPEHPERYSLLTKTECKEDYLLTDPELKDEELLPHLLRPNPHRSSYSNMMLYLRCQVESFAFSDKKWGSPEALDAEFEKRQKEKKARKEKKFEAKLKDLRRKTKSNLHVQRKEAAHVHEFVLQRDEETGEEQEVCAGCGMDVDVETF